MPHRFAIYYAPPVEGLLWDRACQWLGRDPHSDRRIEADVPGAPREQRNALSQSARRYGFHATVKAPMALATGRSQTELESALDHFVRRESPVRIGRLVLASLDGFIALIPANQSAALTEFAARVVEVFEPFRAPLSPTDRARRVAGGYLTERQVELLDRYGYPSVLEQFQFHMTLTDRLPEDAREPMMAAARAWFAPAIEGEFVLDRLALFREAEPGAPFTRLGDHLLREKVTS